MDHQLTARSDQRKRVKRRRSSCESCHYAGRSAKRDESWGGILRLFARGNERRGQSALVQGREYQICGLSTDDVRAEWMGNVDTFDGQTVRGWVFKRSDASRQVWVEVLSGPSVIGRGRTGRPRPDVTELYGVEGQPGFSIEIMISPEGGGGLNPHDTIWVRLRDDPVILAPYPLEPSKAVIRRADERLKSVQAPARLESPPDWPPADPLKSRAVAFYLPQFHPFPENDEWWGRGFTEWRNVAGALPQYEGHDQPRIPSDLGFYDLRLEKTLPEQGRLAREHGISAFCFYTYWFSGRPLMNEVLDQLANGIDPVIDFCLCWANETWSRRWDGSESEVLLGQHHDAGTDVGFIDYVMPLLKHPKYLRVADRPVLLVYRADILDDAPTMLEGWRRRAAEEGLAGLFILMVESFGLTDPRPFGFDGAVQFPPHGVAAPEQDPEEWGAVDDFEGKLYSYDAAAASALADLAPRAWPRFPGVMPGWDNTPRRGARAHVFTDASVDTYESWLYRAAHSEGARTPDGSSLVFINAWNEWAEGAYLEPDTANGRARLEATRSALSGFASPRAVAHQLQQLADQGGGGYETGLLAAAARTIRALDRVNAHLARTMAHAEQVDDFLAPGEPLPQGIGPVAMVPGWLDSISGRSSRVIAVGSAASITVGGWSLAGLSHHEARDRFLVFRGHDVQGTFYTQIGAAVARPELLVEAVTDSAWVAGRAGFHVGVFVGSLPPGRYSIEVVAGDEFVEACSEFSKQIVVIEDVR